MALWKEPAKSSPESTLETVTPARFDAPAVDLGGPPAPKPASERLVTRGGGGAESMIAPDITIEGKIEGSGHVRIAGRFQGDVNVDGDLSIESGATVTGSVRAHKVTVAGELIGNIENATHVELLSSGALTGDLKAGSLAVAAGSRMRGQAEFGWDESKNNGAGNRKNGAKHDGPGRNAEADNTVQ